MSYGKANLQFFVAMYVLGCIITDVGWKNLISVLYCKNRLFFLYELYYTGKLAD